MLKSRIIPVLLLKKDKLVKTIKFNDEKYIGDPLNAVRIFNEKEVDELVIIDISATTEKREPNYQLIAKIASECRMPLCYGGGVNTSSMLEKIISLGVEKCAISSSAINEPEIIYESAKKVGNQSVVFAMDVKKNLKNDGYKVFTHNGLKESSVEPFNFAKKIEELGAGEILLNVIDRDGSMIGYDLNAAVKLREKVKCPITILGGAGSYSDISIIFNKLGLIGAAAGSTFVFKGKYRAVLINYPTRNQKQEIYEIALR